MTCLQWPTTLTEERTAWKTICCAFIRRISHISLGPIHFIRRKLSKVNPQSIKMRPNKQSEITEGTGSKEEEDIRRETVLREFAWEYGRSIRQENVRSKTKELTGTLPCALSMCPTTIVPSHAAEANTT